MEGTQPDNIIVALDLGTSKISVAVAEVTDAGFNVIAVNKVVAQGMQHGCVQNVAEAVACIRLAINEAQDMAGCKIERIGVALTGRHLHSVNRTSRHVITDGEITARDMEQARQMALAFDPKREGRSEDDGRVIWRHKGFSIDNDDVLSIDPIGMRGNVLCAHVHMAIGSKSIIDNLMHCIHRAGLEVDSMVLQPWASSDCCLTDTEKELGVVLLDIGAGTTDIAGFSRGQIDSTEVRPVGGEIITRDIASVLRCRLSEAEEIKRRHLHIYPTESDKFESVVYELEATGDKVAVPVETVINIARPRCEELLRDVMENVLIPAGWNQRAAAGVVLTGGVSLIPGIDTLAMDMFGLPVRIARPTVYDRGSPALSEPEDATVLGVLHHMIRKRRRGGEIRVSTGPMSKVKKFVHSMIYGDFAN